jgi:Uma2 family endonuclease
MKVNVNENRRFFYPDIVVTCDQRDNPNLTYINFPKLIIEVLSPSTESFDRGEKFAFYREIPSLQEYILVNADKYLVECFRRQSKDIWLLQTYEGQAAIAQIEALGIDAPLAEIYATVELTPKS